MKKGNLKTSLEHCSGFTLIELLVVVLIIGILASAGLPQYTRAIEKARTAEAKQMMGDMYNAKKLAKIALRTEPKTFDQLDVKFGAASGAASLTTKNFTYHLYGIGGGETLCGSRQPAPIRAEATNGKYRLIYCAGRMECEDIEAGTCKNLGFVTASSSCLYGGSCFKE